MLGASLLAACASTTSKVRVDKAETDLGHCRSFAWLSPSKEAASFTEQRVRTEALNGLKAKGYTEAQENPDCRITYAFSTQQRRKSGPGVGVGVGGGSGGIGGGIGITLPIGREKKSGTFTLDVVDASRNAQIWSGSLDGSFDAEELNEAEAKEVVKRVLAEFPDSATPKS
jgi:hypothetical protein